LKIALGNLNHKTVGRHSSHIPLGIAYIASYVLENVDGVEIRLYDDVDKILKDIVDWSPDIIGLSNYCWNSNVSSLVFRYSKNNNPDIVTVSGGPDFPESRGEIEEYMRDRKEVDFYVYREGEIPFLDLSKNILEGVTLKDLKQKKINGAININPISGEVIIGEEVNRINDLDVIPSPYLNHLLDSWMDGGYVPSIETTRGCPFSCFYCHTGNICYNKVGKFSVARIKKELDYISDKMRNCQNIPLSICDTNFGIYKKDESIIKYIKEIQLKYNWPILFDVTTGKLKYEKILDMIKDLGGTMRFDCAVQSMNPLTLEIIKRKNPLVEEYHKLQEEAKENDIIIVSEFIVPLPEETKDSFLNGIKKIMDSGIEYIFSYTTMLLKGTELESKATREKYSMTNKFRILPKMFGEYADDKCFEIEEVCVSTNTMSYDEYIECRGFVLISYLIGSDQIDIISRITRYLGISNFDYIINLWEVIKNGNKNEISDIYCNYIEETKNELWDSTQDIYNFFSIEENYNKLLRGELGDNLIRKYRTKIIVEHYNDIMDLFYSVINDMISDRITNELSLFLNDSKLWCSEVRDIGELLYGNINTDTKEILLSYDIDKWYCDNDINKSINDYKRLTRYHIYYKDTDKIKKVLLDRSKLLGGSYFYNIGKLLNDGKISFLWYDCKTIS